MIRRAAFFRRLIESSSLPSKIGARYYTAHVATSLQSTGQSDDESIDIDWENLGFHLMPTDYMYLTKSNKDGHFEQGQLNPYGNIHLCPSAGVLNYGQGLFEGTKAYRRDDGRLFLFRPHQNAIRMQIGAERMCMPCPSIQQFVDAVKQTALANKRFVIIRRFVFKLNLTNYFVYINLELLSNQVVYLSVEKEQIPPPGKGSLYIRPLLIGSGPILGLAPASEYTFLVYACPVGNYFKEGTAPLNLYVEEDLHRASRGGAGGVKSITNYAPVLRAIKTAKEKGFSDVLYLDSLNKRYIEEVSSCNIFLVKGKVLSTPAASGTILEGVTRKSIMDIARDLGYQVEERLIDVDELTNADEVFCTGTAVGVASVGSITYKGKRIEYKERSEQTSKQLYSRFIGIQSGVIEDKRDWIVEIE